MGNYFACPKVLSATNQLIVIQLGIFSQQRSQADIYRDDSVTCQMFINA